MNLFVGHFLPTYLTLLIFFPVFLILLTILACLAILLNFLGLVSPVTCAENPLCAENSVALKRRVRRKPNYAAAPQNSCRNRPTTPDEGIRHNVYFLQSGIRANCKHQGARARLEGPNLRPRGALESNKVGEKRLVFIFGKGPTRPGGSSMAYFTPITRSLAAPLPGSWYPAAGRWGTSNAYALGRGGGGLVRFIS